MLPTLKEALIEDKSTQVVTNPMTTPPSSNIDETKAEDQPKGSEASSTPPEDGQSRGNRSVTTVSNLSFYYSTNIPEKIRLFIVDDYLRSFRILFVISSTVLSAVSIVIGKESNVFNITTTIILIVTCASTIFDPPINLNTFFKHLWKSKEMMMLVVTINLSPMLLIILLLKDYPRPGFILSSMLNLWILDSSTVFLSVNWMITNVNSLLLQYQKIRPMSEDSGGTESNDIECLLSVETFSTPTHWLSAKSKKILDLCESIGKFNFVMLTPWSLSMYSIIMAIIRDRKMNGIQIVFAMITTVNVANQVASNAFMNNLLTELRATPELNGKVHFKITFFGFPVNNQILYSLVALLIPWFIYFIRLSDST